MSSFFLSIFLMFFMLILGLFLVAYTLLNLIALIMGAPYVATNQIVIDEILENISLTKSNFVIELGSGDGRFIRSVVKKYRVNGLGVEIQPQLLLYSRFLAYIQHLPQARFKSQNFYNTDLSSADLIFVFLLPKTLKKLAPQFQKQCKKKVQIISYAFRISGFEKYLVKTLDRKPYSTFFYVLK